jgi:hypothetical protein
MTKIIKSVTKNGHWSSEKDEIIAHFGEMITIRNGNFQVEKTSRCSQRQLIKRHHFRFDRLALSEPLGSASWRSGWRRGNSGQVQCCQLASGRVKQADNSVVCVCYKNFACRDII